MTVGKISAKINPLMATFLHETSLVHAIANSEAGCVHVVFPEIMAENIVTLEKNHPELSIFFSMKSTRSMSLIRAAKECGLGVEVSSVFELNLAGNLEFKQIICGGPKNRAYLSKAALEKTLISVDSISELEMLALLDTDCQILLRISSLSKECSNTLFRPSGFGISLQDLDIAKKIIVNSKNIFLNGFHFHADGYSIDVKKDIAKFFIQQLLFFRKRNHPANTINLGGSWRTYVVKEEDWHMYVLSLIEDVQQRKDIKIWGDDHYGIKLKDNGTILGRPLAEQKIGKEYSSELNELLNSNILDNQSLKQICFESDIKVMIEPGYLLSTTAGLSMFKVILTKKTDCGANLILVDGNIFDISAKMIDSIADPILISNTPTSATDDSFEGYIIGTLCREDDFLIKRKISFSKKPSEGDILVFVNTGSYAMSYESCTPQKFPVAKIKSVRKQDTWVVADDN